MNMNKKIFALEIKATLSALWIFVLLNIIFRDIHELFRPGMLEEMISGIVNGTQVTDGTLLLGGIMLQIPIGMVFLSRTLRYAMNRWANILAGAITIIFVIINNLSPDLDDTLFAAAEVVALSLIIWYAWKWANPELQPNQQIEEAYA
jgi:hypothetical protein